MPLIIHQRNSEKEIIEVLKSYQNKNSLSVVFHCFTGSKKLLNFCLDNNYYISLSGIITYNNAKELREIIKNVSKKLKIQNNVIISSFNPIVLRTVKFIDSSVETGLLFKETRAVGLISFARPNYVHPRSDITTDDLIKYAKRYKLGINVWTVNSRSGMKFFMEKEVNGIITDYPETIPSGT